MLRIIASRVIAEAMLEEVNDILRLQKTASHDLDLISAEPLSEAVLEQVGQITNTVVRLEPGGKQVSRNRARPRHHALPPDETDPP